MIAQKLNFSNNQSFEINSTQYIQNINLKSSVNSTTTVATSGQPTITTTKTWEFPLTLDISEFFVASGGINQTTKARQTYSVGQVIQQNGVTTSMEWYQQRTAPGHARVQPQRQPDRQHQSIRLADLQ